MNTTESSSDLCDPGPGLYVQVMGSSLFLLTWPLVILDTKLLPLGRPAAALIGATMMIIFSIMSQDEVYEVEGRHGNLQTLFLLVGMMLLVFYFDREGLLRLLGLWIFGSRRVRMRFILWKVCVLSGVMAAFITNDATSLVLSPLLFIEFQRQDRPHRELLPLALGIATCANIGSVSTVFGNQQNAYISSSADIRLIDFLSTELPAAVLGLTLNIGLLYLMFYSVLFRERREEDEIAEREERRSLYAAGVELQSCAGSIAEERQVSVLERDRTSDPGLSSQIAQERERMYGVDSLKLPPSQTFHSFGRSQSQHSMLSTHHQRQATSHSPGPVLHEITLPEIRVTHSVSESGGVGEEGQVVVEVIQEGGVVVVESYPDPNIIPLKDRSRRELLFIAWLAFISILTVVLLALPPPPVIAAEFNLGLVPIGASILTMLVDSLINRRHAFGALTGGIDWQVVVMLMGLFAWLRGFQNTCVPHLVFQKLVPHMNLFSAGGVVLFTVFVIVSSNLFSNISLTILVADKLPQLMCGSGSCEGSLAGLLLVWIATVSGNMSLFGSITNLIVAEKARSTAGYKLTFLRYIQFGMVSSCVVIISGLPVVYIIGRFA